MREHKNRSDILSYGDNDAHPGVSQQMDTAWVSPQDWWHVGSEVEYIHGYWRFITQNPRLPGFQRVEALPNGYPEMDPGSTEPMITNKEKKNKEKNRQKRRKGKKKESTTTVKRKKKEKKGKDGSGRSILPLRIAADPS